VNYLGAKLSGVNYLVDEISWGRILQGRIILEPLSHIATEHSCSVFHTLVNHRKRSIMVLILFNGSVIIGFIILDNRTAILHDRIQRITIVSLFCTFSVNVAQFISKRGWYLFYTFFQN
jgi:hypothetical protein